MLTQSRNNQIAFAVLILATLLTYLLLDSSPQAIGSESRSNLIILAVMCKFFFIAFVFMDLKVAHPAYLTFIAFYLLIMGGSFSCIF